MPEKIWNEWFSSLKNKLTKALGYVIREPEEGDDFKSSSSGNKKDLKGEADGKY